MGLTLADTVSYASSQDTDVSTSAFGLLTLPIYDSPSRSCIHIHVFSNDLTSQESRAIVPCPSRVSVHYISTPEDYVTEKVYQLVDKELKQIPAHEKAVSLKLVQKERRNKII